jgi:hypothetical protein
MNPQWIIAILTALGFFANGLWTVINLRIENRVLAHIGELKDWVDARYVRLAHVPAYRPSRANGSAEA